MFNMGLTERHIKQFQGKRIFNTVFFENLPQLCVQIWYFIDRKDSDIVAILAFLSSGASVFLAFIDVYSSASLIQVTCRLYFELNGNINVMKLYLYIVFWCVICKCRQ